MKASTDCECAAPDAKELDDLPILHSVVMETLRLYPPVSKPLAREVPYPSCRIGQYEIPRGMRIEASPYVLHHSESAFPNPTLWDHRRWLEKLSDDEYSIRSIQQYWDSAVEDEDALRHFTLHGTLTKTRNYWDAPNHEPSSD